MIQPKIDADSFSDLLTRAPLIAFQGLQYGWAVAAPGEAYYAPLSHPGGGNLPESFRERLGLSALVRLSKPALRTLKPTAKPLVSHALTQYLIKLCAGDIFTFEDAFKKASGDHPAVIESQTQVVINAIEQHGRPDLQAAIGTVKLSVMSDALDLVIEHAESARDLCEVGQEDKPMDIRLHLMQATQAMKTCLELLLKP